ncbi:MAG: hypothetical protein ACI9SE_004720, partial [Neolewinella sp.]
MPGKHAQRRAPPPALLGFQFNAQYFAIDPAGVAFGIASATPAIECVFG